MLLGNHFSNCITKLNLELYFIKNLQKDFDFPILSKMGIILNDTITSHKLFNEYKKFNRRIC